MSTSRPVPRNEDAFVAPYWAALRNREFLLPRDTKTGDLFSPILALGVESYEWVPGPRTGTIASYSWVHMQPSEGFTDKLPFVLAVVALDGGPQMMSNIIDASESDVWIGRAVQLVFETRADGWVIPQFTPA